MCEKALESTLENQRKITTGIIQIDLNLIFSSCLLRPFFFHKIRKLSFRNIFLECLLFSAEETTRTRRTFKVRFLNRLKEFKERFTVKMSKFELQRHSENKKLWEIEFFVLEMRKLLLFKGRYRQIENTGSQYIGTVLGGYTGRKRTLAASIQYTCTVPGGYTGR